MSTEIKSDAEISHGFPDLLLIYNAASDQIEVSVSNRKIFPEFTGLNFKQSTYFLNLWIETSEKTTFHNKWAICQRLKANEEYSFICKFNTHGAETEIFNINCKAKCNTRGDNHVRIVVIFSTIQNWMELHHFGEYKTQLANLNKKVEKMRNEQDEFIQIASHDLHGPLRKLSSFTDLLINKIPNVEDKIITQYKQKIDTSVSQMREMLDRLTTLSEVSSGNIQFQRCKLTEILNKVLNDLDKEIKLNNAVITVTDMPAIECIPKQMHELFKNLVENSILYCHKDCGVNIGIQFTEFVNDEQFLLDNSESTTYLQIVIKDNGIGMDKEVLERIFQPFVRLHGKSEYPGYGLGLAICKRIVENHNGRIYAESDKNGSRFIILLPRVQ